MFKRFLNWILGRKNESTTVRATKGNPMFPREIQQMASPLKAYQRPVSPRPAPPPPVRRPASVQNRPSYQTQPVREVHHHHRHDDTDYVTPVVAAVVMSSILSDDTPSRSSSNDRCDYDSRNDYSDSSSSSSCDSFSD